MIGLPQLGDRVRVWPCPGRAVQDGARTLDQGGRWLTDSKEVVWTECHQEQMRAGDLLLHEPPAPPAPSAPKVELSLKDARAKDKR